MITQTIRALIAFTLLITLLNFRPLIVAAGVEPQTRYDIVIYGGTASGVVAALEASRLGKRVLLIANGTHLGGLTSGGLGATDIGNKGAIGGISREFYERVARHYAKLESWMFQSRDEYFKRPKGNGLLTDDPIAARTGVEAMWTFEPHVAEAILKEMLREANVPVRYSERLDLKHGVKKDGKQIASIRMESGARYFAKVFIDASYEGDLMAGAGVSYHVGREANSVYGETLNGVQTAHARAHQFTKRVDPYRITGDPRSGLLPGVHEGGPGEEGSGDKRVQAYNFRMCLTDVQSNKLPIPKPADYDPLRYELLRRYIEAGVFNAIDSNIPMPNHKTDINNNGAFSSDHLNMCYDYPDGDYKTRERITRDHVSYVQGMWWFLQNDPRLPEAVRKEAGRWGLPKDEFTDTNGWPHQLYVREARRMISDLVMTENHCRWKDVAEMPVGLAAYGMDSHNTQRYVKDGVAINEGDVQEKVAGPYPIGYKSIVPKESQVTNLIVPVCLSASHIAYGSIRMEPVFMVLGQSAATAASLAIDQGVPVQRVDYAKLKGQLIKDKQILEWGGKGK